MGAGASGAARAGSGAPTIESAVLLAVHFTVDGHQVGFMCALP